MEDQITILIAENKSLKERLTIVENLCETLKKKMDKLEETITEIEDDIYEEEDDDEDEEEEDDEKEEDDDDEEEEDEEEEDNEEDDDNIVRFLPQK
jgi:hypothetical protein